MPNNKISSTQQYRWGKHQKAFKRSLFLIASSSIFGMLYGVVFQEGILFGFINGFMNGVAISGLDSAWVRQKLGRSLRRLPLLTYTFILSFVWTLVILANMTLTRHWTGLDHDSDMQWMLNQEFFAHFSFCLFLAFTFNLLIRISEFLGNHSLLEILLGVYQNPVEHDLAFLFLDVVGSTRLTEKVGNYRAQKIISELFFDIAGIVDHYDGEVHRYIGDGMVINWNLSKTPITPDILSCLAAIYDAVEHHRVQNEPIYNVAVDLRAGLHDGPVFICEFGDQKRELVYFGDAINTAAALESYCKTVGVRAAISNKLYKKLTTSPLFDLSELGEVIMKDKLEPIECFALHPITTQPSIRTNGSESKILSTINDFPRILRKAWRKI